MAITGTTLSAAITANDLVIPVTSATGFATSTAAPQWVKIDSEFMIIAPSYVSGTSVPVYRRGDQGTAVVAHNALAPVTTGLFSDLTALAPGAMAPTPIPDSPDTIVEYSVSGAIAIPATARTTVVLSKAGVAAMTLGAPGKDQDGNVLFITSNTAQAHTVTATSLLNDGASGAPHTTATFAAQKGAGMTLEAYQGLWQVKGLVNVTIT